MTVVFETAFGEYGNLNIVDDRTHRCQGSFDVHVREHHVALSASSDKLQFRISLHLYGTSTGGGPFPPASSSSTSRRLLFEGHTHALGRSGTHWDLHEPCISASSHGAPTSQALNVSIRLPSRSTLGGTFASARLLHALFLHTLNEHRHFSPH